MKILFYLPNLECGGAETVTVRVANYFSGLGHDVYLITAMKGGGLEDNLDPNINYKCLSCKNQWLSFFPLIKVLNKIRPDVNFATMKESNFILTISSILSRVKSRIVIREANTISQQLIAENKLHQKLKNKLISYTYNYADNVICLSHAMKEDIVKSWSLEPNKIEVINNPIDFAEIKKQRVNKEIRKDNTPTFVVVARLFKQKNHKFLFLALADYLELHGQFQIYIVGDGPLKSELEKLVLSLNLSSCIHFVGHSKNPYQYLFKSDVFILPSHFEGFSNALLEASACGLKILVSDTQSTSVEFVKTYELGGSYKKDNRSDFCQKLNLLVNETNNFKDDKPVDLSDFSFEKIFHKYENIILKN